MARVYHMTWVPSRRGWMKEYRGKKYAVSCRQLNVPESKAESYQAANSWWAAKKAELDAASQPKLRPLLPLEDLAAAIGVQGPLDKQGVALLRALEAIRNAEGNNDPKVIVRFDKDGNATVWPAKWGSLLPEELPATAVAATGNYIVQKLLEGQGLPDHIAKGLPPPRVQ